MRAEQLFEEKSELSFVNNRYTSHIITESHLTESFIDTTIKPMFDDIFSRKVDKISQYESKHKSALAKAKSKAQADGVDASAVEKVVKSKVKENNPKEISPSIIRSQLKDILDELKKQNKFKVITYSLIIFATIFIINTTIMTVLAGIVGPIAATSLTAVFVAPVVEEIGKFIAIKTESTGAFLISFNIGEFLLYMMQASTMGVSLGAMAAIRLLPVAMHTMWTLIMRHKYQKGDGVGSVVGSTTILHMFYNAFPPIGIPMTLLYYMKQHDDSEAKKKGVLTA